MSAGAEATFSNAQSPDLHRRQGESSLSTSYLDCLYSGEESGGINCDSVVDNGRDVGFERIDSFSRRGVNSTLDYLARIISGSGNGSLDSSEEDFVYSRSNGGGIGDNEATSSLFPFHKFRNGTMFGEEIAVGTTTGSSAVMDDLGSVVSLSWSTWVLVALFTTLIVITMVGNVLVCLSVILVRKLRKPQNYLLVSLAISDLFVAIFVMPYAVAVEVYGGSWPFNNALCDLWVSADVLCCTASILNLCGISVDRYRAITTPLEYSSKTTPRRMLAVIFVVWLGSACVSLPPVLLLGNQHEDSHGNSFCSVSQNFWYQIYATMASFYVPLCVMVVVYVKILRVVADKKKQMGWKPSHHQSIHRTSSSIITNHSPSATTTMLVSNSPGGPLPSPTPLQSSATPQHALVTRALVTSSVGGSPVTITTLVSNNTSSTSTPVRKASLATMSSQTVATPPMMARGSPAVLNNEEEGNNGNGNNQNNNKKDSTDSQNSANAPATTPLLLKSTGGGSSSSSSNRNNNYRKSKNLSQRMSSKNAIITTMPNHTHQHQNGANGSAVNYLFPNTAIHRIKKKEKLFGGLKEHKASTTLGIIMSAFVICWLPFFVLALIRPFLTINDIEIPPWMYTLFNWLGYINSALNPVIYATLNRDFRKPFREILCLRCSTLDDMMRREFYHQQYGDDRENYMRRISRPHTENEAVSMADCPTNV